ncbi:serine hydrolase [Saccharopolyspora sp. 5N708]
MGVAASVVLTGCAQPAAVTVRTDSTGAAQTATAAPQSAAAAPVPNPAPTGQATAMVTAVEHWAEDHRRTTIGVAVLDRATGELALGHEASRPMYSASLSKLIVAVDVLQRAHTGLRVTDKVRDWISRALGPSDDEAMNALWSTFDGPGAISRVAGQAGLEDTRAPRNTSRWGETLVSARDIVRLYDYVLTELPAEDRDFIVASLAAGPVRATDGFNQAFGLRVLPSGAIKSGWMCCQQGKITLHSAGITDQQSQRFVVALLSSQPSSLGYAKARQELTDAAQAARVPMH